MRDTPAAEREVNEAGLRSLRAASTGSCRWTPGCDLGPWSLRCRAHPAAGGEPEERRSVWVRGCFRLDYDTERERRGSLLRSWVGGCANRVKGMKARSECVTLVSDQWAIERRLILADGKQPLTWKMHLHSTPTGDSISGNFLETTRHLLEPSRTYSFTFENRAVTWSDFQPAAF